MLILYDVFDNSASPDQHQLVASLNVTQNTVGERSTILANLKELYGPDCQYHLHECGHDEGKSCQLSPL